jgi:hypothetical protein
MKREGLYPGFVRLLALVVLVAGGLLLQSCAWPPWGRQQDPMEPYRASLKPEAQSYLGDLTTLPRYDIELFVNPSSGRQVTGKELVIYTHRGTDQLSEVYFRLYPNLYRFGGNMGISSVAVDGVDTAFDLEVNKTALRVPLVEPLEPGASTTLDIGFDLRVLQGDGSYTLLGQDESILSLPLSYPALSVREFRAGQYEWNLDIPPTHFGDTAFLETGLYVVTATVPSDMVTVATGAEITRTASITDVGWDDVVFSGGPRREFMLIMSPQFQSTSLEASDTLVTSYYLPQDQVMGKLAAHYAAASVRVYSRRFGPYPYQEMAVVSAPIKYFGMEYPGLNLIGVDLYRAFRGDLEFLVAHEVAHQWWYSQVGSDPVNVAWLDEGMAEFSTYAYYQGLYGTDRAEQLWELRWRAPYQYAVQSGLDDVIHQSNEEFDLANYEVLVYAKAALFFDSVRREIGDEAYYEALREYLERYRFGIAVPSDFLSVAEEVSQHSLSTLHQQWVLTASQPQ